MFATLADLVPVVVVRSMVSDAGAVAANAASMAAAVAAAQAALPRRNLDWIIRSPFPARTRFTRKTSPSRRDRTGRSAGRRGSAESYTGRIRFANRFFPAGN